MYQKLNGDPPDFQTYAERSLTAQVASAFDRVEAIHREMTRLQDLFASLNPDDVYTVNLNDGLQPYDTSRGGFPVGFKDSNFIPFTDPGRNTLYSLQFDNVDDYNLIAFPDVQTAREFSLQHQLGPSTVGVGYDLAFHFVRTTLPPVQGSTVPVVAHIDAARISKPGGNVLAEMAPRAESAQTAIGTPDVQGIRIGMTFDEADTLASGRFSTARRDDAYKSSATYFNNYANSASWGQCGKVQVGFSAADIRASYGGSSQRYSDCLGFTMAGMFDRSATPAKANQVHDIYADQKLTGVAIADVKASLIKKYGRPTAIASNSAGANVNEQYSWTLPLEQPGERAQIDAWLTTDQRGADHRKDLDLLIHMQPYVDTRARPVEPHVSGGPRL